MGMPVFRKYTEAGYQIQSDTGGYYLYDLNDLDGDIPHLIASAAEPEPLLSIARLYAVLSPRQRAAMDSNGRWVITAGRQRATGVKAAGTAILRDGGIAIFCHPLPLPV